MICRIPLDPQMQIFADDTKLFIQISSSQEAKTLQEDLANLDTWADTWRLRFNAKKCKVLHLESKNSHHEYRMLHNAQDIIQDIILDIRTWKRSSRYG